MVPLNENDTVDKKLCCPKCLENNKLVTVKGVVKDGKYGIKCKIHGFVPAFTVPTKGAIKKQFNHFFNPV